MRKKEYNTDLKLNVECIWGGEGAGQQVNDDNKHDTSLGLHPSSKRMQNDHISKLVRDKKFVE